MNFVVDLLVMGVASSVCSPCEAFIRPTFEATQISRHCKSAQVGSKDLSWAEKILHDLAYNLGNSEISCSQLAPTCSVYGGGL